MKIVYATLEDGHSPSKLQDADIPRYSAVYVQVGKRLFALNERDGDLEIQVEGQIAVIPVVSNVIRVCIDHP